MKLLEVFLLMERTDRLNYIAQNMQKKILKRWTKHIDEAGTAGLPREWKKAYHDGKLPDPSWRGDKENDNWTPELAKSGTEWIVEWFSQFDPTQNKKYTDWIIRQWLTGKLWLEDASKIKSMLETFEDHKNNLKKMDIPSGDEDYRNDRAGAPVPPPERRGDLNSWKDYRVLARILRPLVGVQAAGEKVSNFLKKPEIQDYMNHPVPDPVKTFGTEGSHDIEDIIQGHPPELRGEFDDDPDPDFDTMDWYGGFGSKPDEDATTAIEPIYKSDRLAVLRPNTRAAACELGKGTKWCTSSTESENYFWDYATDGPLYVILTDKMGKFQFHFESEQFMDVHDEQLSEDEEDKLVTNYPELKQIFATEALRDQHDWLVDPSLWTPEKLEDFVQNNKHHGAVFTLIKEWDGIVPEETILYLEQLARTTRPAYAYEFIRNPIEDDYERAILASIEEGEGNAAKAIKGATENGIVLDDRLIGAAIKSNALNIAEVPLEQVKRNPDFALPVIDNSFLLGSIAKAANGFPETSHNAVTPEQGQSIMAILRAHPKGPKAIIKAVAEHPHMIHNVLDYFGTDPWKAAYLSARDNENMMEMMAATIFTRHKDMPNLDYNELIAYLVKNGIIHRDTFIAIEHAMGGELPPDVQQELFKISPEMITQLHRPHNRLEYEAHKLLGNGGRAERAQQAREMGESITEGVSPILYHVTQVGHVNEILTDNTIRLTPAYGTRADREQQPEGKIYYLSTARSKTGGYGYPVSEHQKQGAMVVLDGRALMADGYSGKAVDYWGPEYRALGKNEMEDRIFSKKSTIPNASKYIKEIHILFDTDNEYTARSLKALGYKAKRLNVPLYVYNDQQAFAMLDKSKAASVKTVDAPTDKLPLPGTDVEPRGYRSGPPKNYFAGWMELLNVNDESQLSKVGRDALHKAGYMDAASSVNTDIHNARNNRERPNLDKFLAVLQRLGINSTQELMSYVNNKFS